MFNSIFAKNRHFEIIFCFRTTGNRILEKNPAVWYFQTGKLRQTLLFLPSQFKLKFK